MKKWGEIMLFFKRPLKKTEESLTFKIKKDLASSLESKGINYERIEIGIKTGKINIEVFLQGLK
jgi:hypothetical protein